jgi:hypothetical protein
MTAAELCALPVTVPLVTAGRAFGLCREQSYDLYHSGSFPVPVIKVGTRYKVSRTELLRVLGIDDAASVATAG